MNSLKCPSCHLVNLETDFSCRRCGSDLHPSTSRYAEPRPPKKGISIFSIILIGGVIAFVAWAYTNIQKEMGEIDSQRFAADPMPGSQGYTSRGEAQKARTAAYGNAVQNSSGLAEHQRRVKETEKLVQNTSIK